MTVSCSLVAFNLRYINILIINPVTTGLRVFPQVSFPMQKRRHHPYSFLHKILIIALSSHERLGPGFIVVNPPKTSRCYDDLWWMA